MDLRDTPDEAAFRAEVRAWLERNAPRGAQPARGTPEHFAAMRAWHRTLHGGGYIGLAWPAAYGGRDVPPTHQLIFEEELGRVGAPIPSNLGVSNVGPAIMEHGTDEQKARYLPKILSGEEFWCQGFSEPNAGSDLASLQTRGTFDGDDIIVNGQKVWTTWAEHADRCQLLVRTEPDEPKHRGISCLLVDMRTPGITVRPIRQISGKTEFYELFFDDVRVSVANLLGARADGWRVAISTLSSERAGILSFHVRVQREVAELAALARAKGREGDPLVRQALGRCAIEARALQLFSYWAVSNDRASHGPMAKLLWSELVQRIYETAVLVLDVRDDAWMSGVLDARGLSIAAGTSEVQKNLIAERALGLPK